MKQNINYIETTLNGYIVKRIKIAEYDPKVDYIGELHFVNEGEDVEYYNDIAGDFDMLDKFLKDGSNTMILEYQDVNHLGTKENVLLEYWKTDTLGWFDDRYIGIEISNKGEIGNEK